MSRERKKWVFATILFVIVAVVLTTVFWGIENLITEDAEARRLHVWIELLGGTLPDLDQYGIDRTTWRFAATLTVKFYLLLLPTIGVIALFYNLATVKRRQLMRWMDLLATRDVAIKTAIRRRLINQRQLIDERLRSRVSAANKDEEIIDDALFAEISEAVNNIFEEGREVWEKKYLPRLLDRTGVQAVQEELQEELPERQDM